MNPSLKRKDMLTPSKCLSSARCVYWAPRKPLGSRPTHRLNQLWCNGVIDVTHRLQDAWRQTQKETNIKASGNRKDQGFIKEGRGVSLDGTRRATQKEFSDQKTWICRRERKWMDGDRRRNSSEGGAQCRGFTAPPQALTFALVAVLVPVPELQGLVDAGGGSAGHGRPEQT